MAIDFCERAWCGAQLTEPAVLCGVEKAIGIGGGIEVWDLGRISFWRATSVAHEGIVFPNIRCAKMYPKSAVLHHRPATRTVHSVSSDIEAACKSIRSRQN